MSTDNRPPRVIRSWTYAAQVEADAQAEHDAAVDTLAEHYHECGFGPDRARAMAQALAELPDREVDW